MSQLDMNAQAKVKNLLMQLFRFDSQDLNFGIYRIMNFKRREITRFIEKDLIAAAEEEFKDFAKTGLVDLERGIETLKLEINRDFGEGTIDEEGNVRRNEDAPKIREYISKRKDLQEAQLSQIQINDVFNSIYEFFSRYYEKGDFVTKRRYGGRSKYYLPYNGEEVQLRWANENQLYVKSTEYFKTFSFQTGNYTINFILKDAETDVNNVKGENRYFFLAVDQPLNIDKSEKTLDIFFHWRALSPKEEKQYGNRNVQETITQATVNKILDFTEKTDLYLQLQRKVDGEISVLEKHIDTYIDKNTSNFFVHKNLKSFFEVELDFFLKNEVFDINDISKMDEKAIRINKAKIQTIQNISKKIIDFLAQIEDFQKRLFEKKKFVISADYCITIDLIPEKFYDTIGRNEDQVTEWKKLYLLDDSTKGSFQRTGGKKTLSADFLKSNKNLMIDTKFFDAQFKYEVLSSFENLDDRTDGIIVNSEAFQALNLLKESYREKVDCVYIDPPYNTGSDEFIYKDNYQHSCWLSMIADRLVSAKSLMTSNSVIFTSIDDHEITNLRLLEGAIFKNENFLGQLVWKKKYTGGRHAKYFVDLHEYLLVYSIDAEKVSEFWMNRPEDEKAKFEFEDKYVKQRGKYYIRPLKSNLGERQTLVYAIRLPDGKSITTQWICARDTFEELLKQERILFKQKRDGNWQVYRKYYELDADGRVKVPSIIDVSSYNEGKEDYKRLFHIAEGRDIPVYTIKPVELISFLLSFGTNCKSTVLDFFAGTGTTANAVINLNRNDDGKRKYVLVEMDNFIFESILKPRLEKIAYSRDWKDGSPTSRNGSSHMFKYLCLEQFEDALNNIVFKETDKSLQETLDTFRDYFIRYMLDYETRVSPTRLMVHQFKNPFNYKIKNGGENGQKEVAVDLVETFNYLLGIKVHKIRSLKSENREYRVVEGKVEDKNLTIIWRNTEKIDLQKDKEFIESKIVFDNGDVYVNGENYVRNARVIEPEFKKLMGV